MRVASGKRTKIGVTPRTISPALKPESGNLRQGGHYFVLSSFLGAVALNPVCFLLMF
jgi:hypothetical protein